MRVLHAVYYLGYGGIESLLMGIYKRIDREQIQFDFLTHAGAHYQGDLEEEIAKLGGHVYHAPKLRGHATRYADYVRGILCSEPDIRVVHGHNLDSCSYIYMREARRQGSYVIAHSHMRSESTESLFPSCERRLARFMTRRVPDHFFAASIATGRYAFGERIVQSANFEVLPNGIDLSRFVMASEEHDLLKGRLFPYCDGPVIFNSGRLEYQKNQTFLLDIMAQLLRWEPKAILAIAGDGSLQSTLERKAHNLGIGSHLMLLGYVPNIPDYLKAADVFLLPSISEGLPLAALEAQAAGLPTLLSDACPEVACCTHLGRRLPLSLGARRWAQEVLEILPVGAARADATCEVRAAGFDVKDVASRLQNFYLEHSTCPTSSDVNG